MPANPLHFLAIAPLHFRWPETYDITALLYSSILVDLELLYSFLSGQPMSHGIWHSYLYVLTIYPAALGLIVYAMERGFEKTIIRIHRFFRVFPDEVKYPFRTIYLNCLVGGTSHVFFDMWVHETSPYVVFPLYEGNPLWIGESGIIVHALVALLSIYALFLWRRRALLHRESVSSESTTEMPRSASQ